LQSFCPGLGLTSEAFSTKKLAWNAVLLAQMLAIDHYSLDLR
jgi:hypothetical protein